MSKSLTVAAFLEATTGLALVVAPSAVTSWLMGESVAGAGAAVARFAGIALVALAWACRAGRQDVASVPSPLQAMTIFNVMTTLFLAYLGAVAHLAGVLWWPAVALHAVMTLVLVRAWHRERPPDRPAAA